MQVCPTCGMAITSSVNSLVGLTEADMVCSDFELGDVGEGVGPSKPSCFDTAVYTSHVDRAEHDAYGNAWNESAATVDEIWAAAPTTASAPCCRNSTLLMASIILLSRSQMEGGIVMTADNLTSIATVANGGEMDDEEEKRLVKQFILLNINGNENFNQVRRHQRTRKPHLAAAPPEHGSTWPRLAPHMRGHNGLGTRHGSPRNAAGHRHTGIDLALSSARGHCRQQRALH